MIPGQKINVIFCVVRLQDYVTVSEILEESTVVFINHIILILHKTASKWEGWANKTEGEKFVLTWKLPSIDDTDNEKNE